MAGTMMQRIFFFIFDMQLVSRFRPTINFPHGIPGSPGCTLLCFRNFASQNEAGFMNNRPTIFAELYFIEQNGFLTYSMQMCYIISPWGTQL